MNINSTEKVDLSKVEDSFQNKFRVQALKIYKSELNRPTSVDLGIHGVTRATLRSICKNAVLESSKTIKRRRSHSILSSSFRSTNLSKRNPQNNVISTLRSLQKERHFVSRIGFPDRAIDIDKEIDIVREQANKAREKEEEDLFKHRMEVLAAAHERKEQRLEQIIAEEQRQLNEKFADEEQRLIARQETEFLRVLETATHRATGYVKKCKCEQPYVCRHNKITSYQTRRPSPRVIQCRRNVTRLQQAGRLEEAAHWEDKAKALDEEEQERWCERIAESIVASPWGANEAAVDQVTELHKRELSVLRKSHEVKREMHEKKQSIRRKNFANTKLAEERKVRIQCRKLAQQRFTEDKDGDANNFVDLFGDTKQSENMGETAADLYALKTTPLPARNARYAEESETFRLTNPDSHFLSTSLGSWPTGSHYFPAFHHHNNYFDRNGQIDDLAATYKSSLFATPLKTELDFSYLHAPSSVSLISPSAPSRPVPSMPSFRAGLHLNNSRKPCKVHEKVDSFAVFSFPILEQQLHAIPSTDPSPNNGIVNVGNHDGSDNVFDPVADMQPVNFGPGSTKDTDWVEYDSMLVMVNGIENSYGVDMTEVFKTEETPIPTEVHPSVEIPEGKAPESNVDIIIANVEEENTIFTGLRASSHDAVMDVAIPAVSLHDDHQLSLTELDKEVEMSLSAEGEAQPQGRSITSSAPKLTLSLPKSAALSVVAAVKCESEFLAISVIDSFHDKDTTVREIYSVHEPHASPYHSFGILHEPPVSGTPEASPVKSALSNSKKKSIEDRKSVQFGQDEVVTFECVPVEEEEEDEEEKSPKDSPSRKRVTRKGILPQIHNNAASLLQLFPDPGDSADATHSEPATPVDSKPLSSNESSSSFASSQGTLDDSTTFTDSVLNASLSSDESLTSSYKECEAKDTNMLSLDHHLLQDLDTTNTVNAVNVIDTKPAISNDGSSKSNGSDNASLVTSSNEALSWEDERNGPIWDLVLFRLTNLDNVSHTLDCIVHDDDLYEAAELYITTVGPLLHHSHSELDANHNDNNADQRVLDLRSKLQLLRGWKRFLKNSEDREGVLIGLEDVLQLKQEVIANQLMECLRYHEPTLHEIFQEVAIAFVPEFILSSDCRAYFEAHFPHNQNLRIDSKNWFEIVQKVCHSHSLPFHWIFHRDDTVPTTTSYANKTMRFLFGSLCDTVTPHTTYVDAALNEASIMQEFAAAWTNEQDIVSHVTVRTMHNDHVSGIIAVKHIHSYLQPHKVHATLVVFHDLSQFDAPRKWKIAQSILKAIPN